MKNYSVEEIRNTPAWELAYEWQNRGAKPASGTTQKKKSSSDKALAQWAKNVKARDGMKCRMCGSVDKLHSHHLKSKKDHPQLKYEIDNGLTLCAPCHAEAHGTQYNGLGKFPSFSIRGH